MTKLSLLLFLSTSLFSVAFGQSKADDYINTYKNAALFSMGKYKIPASITLAQGILESSYGQSDIARRANNHFGIKCHGDWNGKRIYADDDRKNECFRKYRNVSESFADHSQFLSGNVRYAALFELDITDYKGWAKGLKRAGYATNPKYPTLLIGLIERYNLDRFDQDRLPESNEVAVLIPATTAVTNKLAYYVVSGTNETVASIAVKNDLSLNRLLQYNELGLLDELVPGQVLYLQAKKSKARKGYDTHVLQEGETLFDVAHQYGIYLSALLKLNRLGLGSQPRPGTVLQLRNRKR